MDMNMLVSGDKVSVTQEDFDSLVTLVTKMRSEPTGEFTVDLPDLDIINGQLYPSLEESLTKLGYKVTASMLKKAVDVRLLSFILGMNEGRSPTCTLKMDKALSVFTPKKPISRPNANITSRRLSQ